MVHRAADSRLLTNLLTHEKDYAKSIKSLIAPSSSNALSAYAAACTPPLSNALLRVSAALGGADEALGRYADAVEECREVLKRVRELEEDVGVVVRDREILITRLIKASKSHKHMKSSSSNSNRDSLQLNFSIPPTHTGSASTLSLSSSFSSPSQTHTQSTIPIPTTATSSKLNAAQAELQACEATLAQKERALHVGRVDALREGLGARCRALMECGWVWAEVGKEALRALEVLNHNGDSNGPGYASGLEYGHGHGYSPFNGTPNAHPSSHEPQPHTNKPLPLPHPHPHLETETETYYIPPAHAISDTDPFPASSSRRVLPRRITEEDLGVGRGASWDEDGGSSADEQEDVRVVDNPRYLTGVGAGGSLDEQRQQPRTPEPSPSPRKGRGWVGRKGTGTSESSPSVSLSPRKGRGLLGKKTPIPQTQAKKSFPVKARDSPPSSSGFFGSLKGLFGAGPGGGSRASSPSPSLSPSPFYDAGYEAQGGGGGLFGRKGKGKENGKGKGKWDMRTERNLREIEREMYAGVGVAERGVEGERYAHMRESVRGRGRVVSDAGPGSRNEEGHGHGKEGGDTKRKLRKGVERDNEKRKSGRRSLSVPPASAAEGDGGGGLFERRYLDALELRSPPVPQAQAQRQSYTRPLSPAQQQPLLHPHPHLQSQQQATPTPSPTVKRQKSARKPPLQEGVREGYTVTVLGRSNPPSLPDGTRRGSLDGAVPSPTPESRHVQALSRDGSIRSAASAPPASGSVLRKSGRRVSGGAGGKPMPSFAGVVGEAGAGAGAGGVEVPRAPPRVGEVLQREERGGVVPVMVRAPGSVFDTVNGGVAGVSTGAGVSGREGGGGARGGRESTSPASSVSGLSAEGAGAGRKTTRPAVSPLRSALRNSSRTPSPMPAARGAVVSSSSPMRAPVSVQPAQPAQGAGMSSSSPSPDDGASSESGDEVFFEADDGTQGGRENDAPAHAQNGNAVRSEAEEPPPPGASEPRRRKSVRVSLNPTFSATPPAIDDDGDGEGQERNRDPWGPGSRSGSGNGAQVNGSASGSGWGGKGKAKEVDDVWEDSSEEDVEYTRARKLLSRLGGAKKEKGKARR